MSNEQILPTSGPVASGQRTTSGGVAGTPHSLPLDAGQPGISRNSARQPAVRRPGHPDGAPTQQSLAQQGREFLLHNGEGVSRLGPRSNPLIAFSTNSKRPAAQAHSQTIEAHRERGVPIDPDNSRSPQQLAERPASGVRQDKDRNSCDRAASLQPAAVNKFTRSQATSRRSARSKKTPADNRRTQPVQVWVHPLVKEELARIASSEGLSLSAAGAAFLTRGLQQNVDMQYGALLNPVIEKAFAKQMRVLVTRLTWLLVRVAFDAGQTRSLVTNILGRQPGVTQPMLKTILESSSRSAKGNIMRRTPHISQLIEAVEQWMVEDEAQEKEKLHD